MTEADDPGRLFGHPVRAGVLAFLSDTGAADFTVLAQTLGVGNNILSGHLRRLEEGGVIELKRGFLGRRPRTRVVATCRGRALWAEYLDGMS